MSLSSKITLKDKRKASGVPDDGKTILTTTEMDEIGETFYPKPTEQDWSTITDRPVIRIPGFSTPDFMQCSIHAITLHVGLALGCETTMSPFRDAQLIKALQLVDADTSAMRVVKDVCRILPGRALITLICALTVGYAGNRPAEILCALTRQLGAEPRAMVSVGQWGHLVQVCAAVYDDRDYTDKIKASFALGITLPYSPILPLILINGHSLPSLAKIILCLGQIMVGKLRCVHVTGLDQCGWVAVWAEESLGLRLELYDQESRLRRYNFDRAFEQAQVVVRYVKVQGLATSLLTVFVEE